MRPKIFNFFYCLFLGACNGISPGMTKIEEELPGLYVNESISNYSKALDSLLVTRDAGDKNIFLIERKVSFVRIKKGKFGSLDYKLEKWIAVFHQDTGELVETKKGRMLIYIADQKKLYLGNTAYLKLK